MSLAPQETSASSLRQPDRWVVRAESSLKGHVGRVNVVHFLGAQSAEQGYLVSGGADAAIRLWSCARPREPLLLHTFRGGHAPGDVLDVACSPGAIRLASVAMDKAVCLWDVTGGNLWGRLHGHEGQVNSCTFKDANVLLTASSDGTVRIWDVRARSCAQVLPRFSDAVTGVAVSGDGTITACSMDGSIRSFEVRTGRHIIDKSNISGTRFGSLAVNRSNSRIIATVVSESNPRLALLEREGGSLLKEFKGHMNGKVSLGCCFDNADSAVGCASEDGIARFWDIESTCIIAAVDLGEPVLGISHHNARQAFVLCGAQGTIKYYEWTKP